jgi:hypothetical protein
MTKRSAPISVAALAVGGVLVAAVLLGRASSSEQPPPAAEAAPSAPSAPAAPAVPATPAAPADASAEPLTFFEEALVGGWSRNHRYDGSTQYAIFDSDRTGCTWEESSIGSVTKDSSFAYWELSAEKNPNGTYTIAWGDADDDLWSDLYVFDYASDTVYFGSSLDGGRDRDVAECFS